VSIRSSLSKLRDALAKKIILKRLHRGNSLSVDEPVNVNWRRIILSGNNTVRFGRHVICRGVVDCQKQSSIFEIGERSFVGSGSILVSTDKVSIGNDVLIAHDCYITDTDGHALSRETRAKDIPNRWEGYKDWSVVPSAPIVIGDGAWIGPRVTILKGVTVGVGAVICAGSVVTKPVPDMAMVAGVPAKVIRNLEQ
jgi:acetyltransferase-like isoleucine patch superfamily enzyme